MTENNGQRQELPMGWTWANIDDLTSTNGLFCDGDWIESKDQDSNGNVRLIQLADIGDGIFKDKSNRHLTFEKSVELCCTYLSKGDLLVARLPDPLGRACLFPLEGEKKYVTAVDICIVRPNYQDLNIHYLLYLINSPQIRTEVDKFKSGSTRKRISRKNFAKIQLSIAPTLEQHLIADKIEELFSKLDNGIENLKKAREQLKTYRQAVLKYAFEGKLTKEWRTFQRRAGNPPEPEELPELSEGWKWEQIKEITTVLGDGLHGTPIYSDEGNYYFINGNNLSDGKIEIKENTRRVTIKEYEKYKKPLSENTVLVSINGTLGNTAFYNGEKVVLGKSACYFNVLNIIDKHYVRYCITSQRFINYAYKHATGSTIKNVSLKAMREFEIPIPPTLEEQQAIVSEIESRLSVCDKIEQTIEDSLKKSEALRQSILKKAFAGELTRDWREKHPEFIAGENSAEKLLEKIKAEKAHACRQASLSAARRKKPRSKKTKKK
jgi:type I restriction enzyme S subunit